MNGRVSPAPDDLSARSRSDVSLVDVEVGSTRRVVSAGGSDGCVGDREERRCHWCGTVLPIGKRRDSKFCGQSCRQASWRFAVGRADIEATDRPMSFAYADPPYPGKALIYPERTELDHALLLERLTANYPDGWALSTSSEALRDVLSRGDRLDDLFPGSGAIGRAWARYTAPEVSLAAERDARQGLEARA